MPFGAYRGYKMANVPGRYLLRLYESGVRLRPDLKAYIEDNLEVIKTEIKRSNKLNRR